MYEYLRLSKKNLSKLNSGQSLVEVMIAGVVGTMVVFGIMQAVSISQRQSTRNAQRGSWHGLLELMKFSYARPEQCAGMFKGQEFPVPGTGPGTDGLSLTRLVIYGGVPPANPITLLDTATTVNSFRASELKLKVWPGSAPTVAGATKKYQAYLSMRATLEGGVASAAGSTTPAVSNLFSGIVDPAATGSTLPADIVAFWVTTKVDPVTNRELIDGCTSRGGGGEGVSLEEVCKKLDGNAYISPVTGECVINTLNLNSEGFVDENRAPLYDAMFVFGPVDPSPIPSPYPPYSLAVRTRDNQEIIRFQKSMQDSAARYSFSNAVTGNSDGRTYDDYSTCCSNYSNPGCGSVHIPGRGVPGDSDYSAPLTSNCRAVGTAVATPHYSAAMSGDITINDTNSANKGFLQINGTGKGNVPHACKIKTYQMTASSELAISGPSEVRSVQCDSISTEIATGGGAKCFGSHTLGESGPFALTGTSRPVGWMAGCIKAGGATTRYEPLTVWAICCKE